MDWQKPAEYKSIAAAVVSARVLDTGRANQRVWKWWIILQLRRLVGQHNDDALGGRRFDCCCRLLGHRMKKVDFAGLPSMIPKLGFVADHAEETRFALSVVAPCYNEAPMLREFHGRVNSVVAVWSVRNTKLSW